MAFAPVPQEPKKQIDRAGKILISGPEKYGKAYYDALDLANQWRACHAYPINTFQATLRVKLKSVTFGHDPIVAQRLKRMPTMIDKLKRHPNMHLTTMQDIGGLRAILSTIDNVYRLAREYRDGQRLIHELTQEKDYIGEPRDEDGYRSLHLIFKYKNKRVPEYNGLRLELQIRTKLQHIWATAVETMGTFLGQDLKSRKGERAWLDFFAVTSSAFAHQEKSPLVPRYEHLSFNETCRAVAEAEAKIRALETMEAFATIADNIVGFGGHKKSWSYHLIVLDSLHQMVQITAYDRRNIERAMQDYAQAEAEAAMGKKIEPVLVSAGPLSMLRQAYPNFFLDIAQFISLVTQIVGKGKE